VGKLVMQKYLAVIIPTGDNCAEGYFDPSFFDNKIMRIGSSSLNKLLSFFWFPYCTTALLDYIGLWDLTEP
jgi:hypothetical protein